MRGGLFITLYDENTLSLYLDNGLYGFLMNPIYNKQPSARSMHYAALADYACSREGAHVFFFLKRKIVYGGTIKGNKDIASFYLNGDTSPLGQKANAPLFWDESVRYKATNKAGVFTRDGKEKAQPFIIQFEKTTITGKQISSDELYFELGQFPYPLPSNTIQGMSFCTLTPGETEVAINLINLSTDIFQKDYTAKISAKGTKKLFDSNLLEYDQFINEAHIEFTLLADLAPFNELLGKGCYALCRQVPISPFKPIQLDRADICLYDLENPICNGTIPNIIFELKKDKANFKAYQQVVKYLQWLDKVLANKDEFVKVSAYIIAPDFYIPKSKVDLRYLDKIRMYNLNTKQFYALLEK